MIRTLSIALVLALAACGETTSSPATEPSAAETTIDPHAAIAPSGDAVTAEFLVGVWGDNGACTSTMTFNADHSFTQQNGSTGTWALEGDRLLLSGESGEFGLTVGKSADGELMLGQPDGGFGTSRRC